jgi:hypothetical protein
MEQKYMATCHDPDGLTRAWGIAPTRQQAMDEARRQLVKYRAKKREAGDYYLADATFTMKVHTLPKIDGATGDPVDAASARSRGASSTS